VAVAVILRSAWLAMALLACIAAEAAGGSEAEPEIADPAGDTRDPLLPTGDILAAWIEGETPEGFTTVVKLAEIDPARDRVTDHYVVFYVGDAPYCTYTYVGPDGATEPSACKWDPERRLQTGEFERTHGNLTPGAPGYVRTYFPRAFLDDADVPEDRPVVLSRLMAETFDFKRVHDPTAAGNLGTQSLTDHAEGAVAYTTAWGLAPTPTPQASPTPTPNAGPTQGPSQPTPSPSPSPTPNGSPAERPEGAAPRPTSVPLVTAVAAGGIAACALRRRA
jgi:hypothetical protein